MLRFVNLYDPLNTLIIVTLVRLVPPHAFPNDGNNIFLKGFGHTLGPSRTFLRCCHHRCRNSRRDNAHDFVQSRPDPGRVEETHGEAHNPHQLSPPEHRFRKAHGIHGSAGQEDL